MESRESIVAKSRQFGMTKSFDRRIKFHASASSDLALPKVRGLSRKAVKTQEREHRRVWTAQVRFDVWRRAEGRCELCGDTELETRAAGTWPWQHQLHEVVSKAQTRGLPIEDRVNLTISVRACATCHSEWHARLRKVVAEDELAGMDGTIAVLTRVTVTSPWDFLRRVVRWPLCPHCSLRSHAATACHLAPTAEKS